MSLARYVTNVRLGCLALQGTARKLIWYVEDGDGVAEHIPKPGSPSYRVWVVTSSRLLTLDVLCPRNSLLGRHNEC